MKCWKCGMELEEDSVFCDNCGSKVTEEGAMAEGTAEGTPVQEAETEEDPAEGAAEGNPAQEAEREDAPAEGAAEAEEPAPEETAADGFPAEAAGAPSEAAAEPLAQSAEDSTSEEPALSTAPHPWPQEDQGGPREQGSWVFCPNCGKRFAEGEAFCDECGTSLLEDQPLGAPVQDGKAGKPFNKALLAIPAAIAVVALGVAGMSLIRGGGGGGKVPSKLAYFQEESLMLIDLKKKNGEPVEITDSYMEDGGYYEGEDILSPDGTYLFYKEDYDGDMYKLFRAKTSKPEEGEEIDTRVSSHQVLKDNTVLYMKKNKLYWFDGKSSADFGKNVTFYKADENAKYVVWLESEDEEGATFYYQDLAQKTDKVELEKNVKEIRISKDYTKFYVLKDNNKMYQVDNKGNSESLDKDVTQIKSFNSETGEMYFLKSKPEVVNYSEVVFDDTNLMTAGERESLEYDTFEIPYGELYYCGGWGAEPQMISENCGGSFSSDGTYCLFSEYPSKDELKVKWSEMDANGSSYAVQMALEDNSLLKLAVDGTLIAEYEDVEYGGSRYSKDAGKLYIYSEDTEEEDGVIYVTSLKGKGAGELAEYDDDAYGANLLFATEQGLYYLKDYVEASGDLYYNGERVKSDVVWASGIEESSLVACASDYYENTFELSLYDGKKDTSVAKDVSAAECASDGTAVLLADYDMDLSEGDLMYFDGKELRELDTEVTNFVVRRGSAALR